MLRYVLDDEINDLPMLDILPFRLKRTNLIDEPLQPILELVQRVRLTSIDAYAFTLECSH
ncbi:hypothetical protein D3C78_1754460 [compost metagenome]